MRLIDVYEHADCLDILYRLLAERELWQNISHRAMPSWDEHTNFVASQPYKCWFIIESADETPMGACYVSKQNEIGIHLFKAYQGKGTGPAAVLRLMAMYPSERLLANINPQNVRSIELFERLGFRHCQNTYELLP